MTFEEWDSDRFLSTSGFVALLLQHLREPIVIVEHKITDNPVEIARRECLALLEQHFGTEE